MFGKKGGEAVRQREYQFIFFLNISHSFYSETELGKKHSHTWELEVTMHPVENELVQFREAERVIQKCLERFQDRYLNTIAPFHRLNPSIENFLDHVAGEIDLRMTESGWEIKKFRISENPTRTYMIDRTGIDKLREHDDVAEEAAAGAEPDMKPAGTAALAEGAAVTVEPKEPKAEPAEEKPVSKTVIDTGELRVRLQTVGNQSRIVITIP